MFTRQELRDRVEVRKHELLEKFDQLKADTRHDAIEARSRLKQRLDELELHLRGGWDRLTDTTRSRLDQWLQRND